MFGIAGSSHEVARIVKRRKGCLGQVERALLVPRPKTHSALTGIVDNMIKNRLIKKVVI